MKLAIKNFDKFILINESRKDDVLVTEFVRICIDALNVFFEKVNDLIKSNTSEVLIDALSSYDLELDLSNLKWKNKYAKHRNEKVNKIDKIIININLSEIQSAICSGKMIPQYSPKVEKEIEDKFYDASLKFSGVELKNFEDELQNYIYNTYQPEFKYLQIQIYMPKNKESLFSKKDIVSVYSKIKNIIKHEVTHSLHFNKKQVMYAPFKTMFFDVVNFDSYMPVRRDVHLPSVKEDQQYFTRESTVVLYDDNVIDVVKKSFENYFLSNAEIEAYALGFEKEAISSEKTKISSRNLDQMTPSERKRLKSNFLKDKENLFLNKIKTEINQKINELGDYTLYCMAKFANMQISENIVSQLKEGSDPRVLITNFTKAFLSISDVFSEFSKSMIDVMTKRRKYNFESNDVEYFFENQKSFIEQIASRNKDFSEKLISKLGTN